MREARRRREVTFDLDEFTLTQRRTCAGRRKSARVEMLSGHGRWRLVRDRLKR